MRTCLIDTGPLVAYLDANDPAHGRVARFLDDFEGQFVTTSSVLTEAMHFVAETKGGPRALVELLAASRTRVYDLSGPGDLCEAVVLMEKYADVPMDFADATLVLLGQALGITEILTLDRRGFATFRIQKRRALTLVLGAR